MSWHGFDEEWLSKWRKEGKAKLVNWNGEPVVAIKATATKADRKVTQAAVAAGYAPLVGLCRGMGLMEPVPEWVFHPTRKWRFDYAWPLVKLALEIQGGLWSDEAKGKNAHAMPLAIMRDMEKASEAAILGWRIIYCVPDELTTVALDRIQRALNGG